MPRTIWEPEGFHCEENPEYSSPSFLRGCIEETHYEHQRKAFHLPLRIHPASTDADRQLDFRDYGDRNVARYLSQLNPDDCRLFCWKDCAIYGNAGLTASDHFALLDKVYQEWFPHRAEDKDVSDGSFFGKFMRFVQPANMEEILCFHRVLCDKLQSLEKDVEDKPFPSDLRPKKTRRVGAFKLRETFSIVFIVLDAGWQEHGVLLVWMNKDVAKTYCSKEGGEISGYVYGDAGDLGDACVFRCPLERAMQIVVSQDPERAQHRTEYNEVLEETLGGQYKK